MTANAQTEHLFDELALIHHPQNDGNGPRTMDAISLIRSTLLCALIVACAAGNAAARQAPARFPLLKAPAAVPQSDNAPPALRPGRSPGQHPVTTPEPEPPQDRAPSVRHPSRPYADEKSDTVDELGPSEGDANTPPDEPIDSYGREVSFSVVSGLSCDQKIKGKTPPRCRLHYFQADTCGQFSQTDESGFHAGLIPGVPVCIFIHGALVSGPDFVKTAPQVNRWIRQAAPGRPLNVVFYRWPSETGLIIIPQVNAGVLSRRAGLHGIYLGHLIKRISPSHSVSLFGHSHGSRIACSALHALGGGSVQGFQLTGRLNSQRPIRAVLAAAAIDHDWLNPGERYGQALCRAEAIVNLRTRKDRALKLYPYRKPFSRRSLGRLGFTRKDREQLGWYNDKVTEIDVSPSIKNHHFLLHYVRHPEITRASAWHLYFPDRQ